MRMISGIVTFLLCLGTIAKASSSTIENDRMLVGDEWITCDQFFEYSASVAMAAGTRDPRSVPGYSPMICRKAFKHLQGTPDFVNGIVNLGAHFEERRKLGRSKILDRSALVPDVASNLRRRLTPGSDDEDCDLHEFGFGNPGPRGDRDGPDAIGPCVDPSADQCPHAPCVPEYLQADLSDTGPIDTFEEFLPAYGGTGLYELAVERLQNVQEVRSSGEVFAFPELWNGCIRDRTNASPVSEILIKLTTVNAIGVGVTLICEAIPDDIEVPLVCVDLPNPFKIACEIVDGVFDLLAASIENLYGLAEFQDGLVDGAEIEASFEHTRNLLQKQCAIYDQSVCRCAEEPKIGQGCDGFDTNCNDLVDDCDEDSIAPEIFIEDSLCKCSGGRWFATAADAQACVEESVSVQDDCQNVSYALSAIDNCQDSTVTIANVSDFCNNTADDVTLPVLVDGTPPTVACRFGGEQDATIPTTGPSVLTNVGFNYSAFDNCGLPLNVTVTMYSNEIEDFNAQELAIFFENGNANDRAELFLAAGICSTESNGQCIKDPDVPTARIYTAVVSATDVAGLVSNPAECTLTVVPKGGGKKNGGPISISDSSQRFFLTSYSSIFDTY